MMSNIDFGKPRLRALLGGLSTWSCGCCACQPLPRAISVLAMSKDNPVILPPPLSNNNKNHKVFIEIGNYVKNKIVRVTYRLNPLI